MNAAVERRCGVKIGVLQFFSWPERRVELSQVYARALQRIEIMDRTGYDAVWLAEHHFSSFSVCPSVHMMGVLAAARTTRLRIGTGVSLAPFYHPLRLAEEVALLDQVSGDGLIGAPAAALRGSSSRISGYRPVRAPRAFAR